jgi:hypothetical protein
MKWWFRQGPFCLVPLRAMAHPSDEYLEDLTWV